MSLILLLMACWRTKGQVCQNEDRIASGDTNEPSEYNDGAWGSSTGWKSVSVGFGSEVTACVANDERLLCWGHFNLDVQGAFSSVDVGWHHVCAVLETGTMQCWSFSGEGDSVTASPDGLYTLVSLEEDFACASYAEGGVVCWGAESQYEDIGEYSDLAAGDVESQPCFLWGVTTDGDLRCWSPGEASWTTLAEEVQKVSVLGELVCTLSGMGEFSCINYLDPSWEGSMPGTYVDISAGWGLCALSERGHLNCIGSDASPLGDCVPDGEPFQAMDVGSVGCALDEEGRIVCWGRVFPGIFPPP